MKKSDLMRIDHYFKYHLSFHSHLFFRLILETDFQIGDILELRVSDVRGMDTIYIGNESSSISEELKIEIMHYTSFLKDNDFLFRDIKGGQASRTKMWRGLKRGFEELGYEDGDIKAFTLRSIWGGKERADEKSK